MSELEQALDYAKQNREQFLNELIEVLKIPSISTDAEFNEDVQRDRRMDGGSSKSAWHGARGDHAHRLDIQWCMPITLKKPGAPTVWSTDITMFNRLIRWCYGRPVLSSRKCAAICCMRVAPPI